MFMPVQLPESEIQTACREDAFLCRHLARSLSFLSDAAATKAAEVCLRRSCTGCPPRGSLGCRTRLFAAGLKPSASRSERRTRLGRSNRRSLPELQRARIAPIFESMSSRNAAHRFANLRKRGDPFVGAVMLRIICAQQHGERSGKSGIRESFRAPSHRCMVPSRRPWLV